MMRRQLVCLCHHSSDETKLPQLRRVRRHKPVQAFWLGQSEQVDSLMLETLLQFEMTLFALVPNTILLSFVVTCRGEPGC